MSVLLADEKEFWEPCLTEATDPCIKLVHRTEIGDAVVYSPFNLELMAASTINTMVFLAKICRDQDYQKIIEMIPPRMQRLVETAPSSLLLVVKEKERIQRAFSKFQEQNQKQ